MEGFNDVIGLDTFGIPAVALISNRITEMQGDNVAMWARQLAGGEVTLMFDCEHSGIDGAKEALWCFAERQIDVRLAWRDCPALPGVLSADGGTQPSIHEVFASGLHQCQTKCGFTIRRF